MNTTETPKFDWNKPFQTKDGRKVRLLAKINDDIYPYACVVVANNGHERLFTYTESGKLYTSTESPQDLINIPEKRNMWVNVYPDGMIIGHKTRKEANARALNCRIACVEVELEYTPGQGL